MAAYNDDHLKSETLHEMLGQNIRRLRRRKGITQEQLADKTAEQAHRGLAPLLIYSRLLQPA